MTIDDHYRHTLSKYTTEQLIDELSKRELPTPSSQQLLLMAENDWHNREERKGNHDRVSWISGWVNGFMTPGKPEWGKK